MDLFSQVPIAARHGERVSRNMTEKETAVPHQASLPEGHTDPWDMSSDIKDGVNNQPTAHYCADAVHRIQGQGPCCGCRGQRRLPGDDTWAETGLEQEGGRALEQGKLLVSLLTLSILCTPNSLCFPAGLSQ